MPGILPMKVIKVGTSAQSRIAQACDRCRSKKIRCDGVTPCCTQCSNVGFECKTSDKLSRRAFPRGYTESLEERVRALEAEVKELKDLLDEKDEKIDMLSKIHSFSPSSHRPSVVSIASQPPSEHDKEDLFKVQQPSVLIEDERKIEQYLAGPSSGRAFIDAFKTKTQESGRPLCKFDTKDFFNSPSSPPSRASPTPALPPRVVSDQLINVFFQQWAPLFPVLHRPTFLCMYTAWSADPGCLHSPHDIAQLNLVFGTAALASKPHDELLDSYEAQWRAALETIIGENSLLTLECLLLAQIHCLAKGDYNSLLKYSGVAATMSNRLGLHQSQKRFSLDALTLERRKRLFWSLYTLDCFIAAQLGMPRLLKDGDIECEEPADLDDEYVTERGYHPALPGESTRISSALALFRVAKVLAKVLAEEYPAASTHAVSMQRIHDLADDLDQWRQSLAPHLRLEFVQDKPCTKTVESPSLLLSLVYYYIRSVIHRPVVSSGLEDKVSASVVALADSSKHIVQILQLLEERGFSFTVCLNKTELLTLCGFGILFQQLELKVDGKLMCDNQRLCRSIVDFLQPASIPMSFAFNKVACSLLPPTDQFAKPALRGKMSPPGENAMSPTRRCSYAKSQLQAIAARLPFNAGMGSRTSSNRHRHPHPTIAPEPPFPATLAMYSCNGNQASLSSLVSDPGHSTASSALSPNGAGNLYSGSTVDLPKCNLDYFPLDKPHKPSSRRDSQHSQHSQRSQKSQKSQKSHKCQQHQSQPPVETVAPGPGAATIYTPASSNTPTSDWDSLMGRSYFSETTATSCDSVTLTPPFVDNSPPPCSTIDTAAATVAGCPDPLIAGDGGGGNGGSSSSGGDTTLDFLSPETISFNPPPGAWDLRPEAWEFIEDAGSSSTGSGARNSLDIPISADGSVVGGGRGGASSLAEDTVKLELDLSDNLFSASGSASSLSGVEDIPDVVAVDGGGGGLEEYAELRGFAMPAEC